MLEVKVTEVSVTQMGFALILQPVNEKNVVPVFVGPLETYSISSALEKKKPERPLTHDLMKSVLESTGYSVEKVFIDDFRNGTFFAKLFLKDDTSGSSEPVQIDSRPSDSIALAIRFEAPIFMAEHVYESTGIEQHLLKEKVEQSEDELLSSLADSLPDEILSDDQKNELLSAIMDEYGSSVDDEEFDDDSRVESYDEEEVSSLKSRKQVLQEMLESAIARENYEDAARIRDELHHFNENTES